MYNANGVQVGSDLVHSITKTGDAPPVVQLTSSPASQNVALGETLDLDAGTSYDPEGAGPLAYSWTISPVDGYIITNSTATTRRLVFSTPGTYTVTVQATDVAQQSASRSLSISVFNSADFDSFGGNYLTGYTIQSVELRDNYSPDAWYSLNETAGSLVVQVTDSVQHPLTSTAANFPRITRPLPATTDFALQTSFALETRQFGNFATGLFLETVQGGNAVRYAFCLNAGTSLTVYRTALNGIYGSIFSTPYTGGELTLRVLRSGNNLSFQRRLNGVWSNLFTTALPSDSTTNFGGLFVSTFSAVAVRVAFDYLLLGDAGNTSDLINNLRITEIMYNPLSGGAEFIELTNIGATPLLLEGAYFDDGNPFDRFTFGAYTLAPGAFIVVTNDIFAFESMYGFGMVAIAGQFSGLLDNAGERIVLKDADGNVIQDFTYGSAAPWPTSPDGTGVSLEILSPTGDYNDSGNWRAGVEMNGSPGFLGAGFDSDSDGQSDRLELALGTDPNDPASSFRIIDTSRNANGEITLTWPSAPDFTYLLEFTTILDPPDWQPLANVPSAGTMTSYTTRPRRVQLNGLSGHRDHAVELCWRSNCRQEALELRRANAHLHRQTLHAGYTFALRPRAQAGSAGVFSMSILQNGFTQQIRERWQHHPMAHRLRRLADVSLRRVLRKPRTVTESPNLVAVAHSGARGLFQNGRRRSARGGNRFVARISALRLPRGGVFGIAQTLPPGIERATGPDGNVAETRGRVERRAQDHARRAALRSHLEGGHGSEAGRRLLRLHGAARHGCAGDRHRLSTQCRR
jgi:hypothetical protein